MLEYEACEEENTISYLNRDVSTLLRNVTIGAQGPHAYCTVVNAPQDVKHAIHANPDIEWYTCSNTVGYDYSDMDVSTDPYYDSLT
jgi:hypothetical protein